MYLIQTEDFYKGISKDFKRKFDTSDYPENHPSGIKTGVNKKVIGKLKDEAAGKQITHFVGLRPKLYCFKDDDEVETRKAKGVKKNVKKKSLIFILYKKCLFTEEEVMKEMTDHYQQLGKVPFLISSYIFIKKSSCDSRHENHPL